MLSIVFGFVAVEWWNIGDARLRIDLLHVIRFGSRLWVDARETQTTRARRVIAHRRPKNGRTNRRIGRELRRAGGLDGLGRLGRAGEFKEPARVQRNGIFAYFKMQMGSGGPAGLAKVTNALTF